MVSYMTNQEIRAKALCLYRTNFIGLFLLALCYNGISEFVDQMGTYLSNGLQARNIFAGEGLTFYVNIDVVQIVAYLLLAPLELGAILCVIRLWKTEGKIQYADLTVFYRAPARWGGAILLDILQVLILSAPVILTALVGSRLFALSFVCSMAVMVWLSLRIYMAGVLYASAADRTAWQAIRDSFHRMSGQVVSLFCLLFSVSFLPICLELLLGVLMQSNLAWMLAVGTGLRMVVQLFYSPFVLAATMGWVIEHINDEEQPQETGTPQNPVLRQIANDLGKDGKQPGMEDKT